MLPLIAASMSASLGAGFLVSSAVADISWPDWQLPHCGTSCSSQAFCSARPTRVPAKDSIVLTLAPATDSTVVMHERVAAPFTCTVQAPHRPRPQPNFAPVMPSTSRSTHKTGVSPSTSTDRFTPLTFSIGLLLVLATCRRQMLESTRGARRMSLRLRFLNVVKASIQDIGAGQSSHVAHRFPVVPFVNA